MGRLETTSIIDRIYEAPAMSGGWSDALGALHRQIGLDGWALLRTGGQPQVLAMGGERVTAAAEERYRAHYGLLDPRAAQTRDLPLGEVMACHHHFDEHYAQRSEFYQDFLRPQGLRYAMGGHVSDEADGSVILGLLRGPERGPFEDDELSLVRALMCHLQRAWRLQQALDAQVMRAQATETALASTGWGVIGLDLAGQVLLANARATDWLTDGGPFAVAQGRLCGARADENAAFEAALARCGRQGRPVHLLLRCREGARYSVTLMKPAAALPVGDVLQVLCLVAPLERRRVATVQQLMALFGFSPAEARLVRALAHGDTVEDYAASSGVKTSTPRSQLQSAFAKSGVRRQSDLLRMVSGVPPVRETPLR